MLRAIEYLGRVGVGVTIPQFFRAEDGNVYVVKFQNQQPGSRVLVSEFFAAKIGKIMGLCFPPSGIIEIEEQLLLANPCLLELGLEAGRYFGSLYLEDAEYIGKNRLYKAVNVADMAGVILFDHLFHNADRAKNQKNLLLRLENEHYKIYAIDNSHLFRSSRWTIETLHTLAPKIKTYHFQHYRELLKNLLSAQDFIPYIEIVEKLSDEQLNSIVNEIPQEWLPDEAERLALVEYSKLRKDMAEEIWEKLCRFIPRSRGGRRWLFAN